MSALLLSSQYLWTRNKKSVFSYQRSTPCFFLMLTRCTENWKRTQTFLKGCNFCLLSLWNCSFSSQMQLWCAFHWQKKKQQNNKKRTTVNPILPFCTGNVIAFSVLKNVILFLLPHNTTFHWRPLSCFRFETAVSKPKP